MTTTDNAATPALRAATAMRVLKVRCTFLTPAFLGDAQQSGRWRTPPFKHLLREWWRVAYAVDHGFPADTADMRREEGLLFGNAWLEDAFCKSLVRIRLEHWEEGALKKANWPQDKQIEHPEVKNRKGQVAPIGSALYLGYGPLIYDNQQRRTLLKGSAAIQADESARLQLAWPEILPGDLRALLEKATPRPRSEKVGARLERALWLVDRYGALGGRSRNGWGSCALTPLPQDGRLKAPLRPWRDCLALDWPHAIGSDELGALIWQTEPHQNWQALMKTLAILKIGLRTQFVFTAERNAPHAEPRHWLSYPVTNHSITAWSSLRLPNQLRFKVRKTQNGALVGVIFHMPHLPPPAFGPVRGNIERVWEQAHRLLDELTLDANKRTYAMIPDVQPAYRRRSLKPSLDAISLKRIPE